MSHGMEMLSSKLRRGAEQLVFVCVSLIRFVLVSPQLAATRRPYRHHCRAMMPVPGSAPGTSGGSGHCQCRLAVPAASVI
jgi:hypothetical protein